MNRSLYIAYKNILNNFFIYFFYKKYIKKQKFQKKKFEFRPFLKKLWAKSRNSISFKSMVKKISKFTKKRFLMGIKKMSKNEGNQKLKFFKPSNLAWNAPYVYPQYIIFYLDRYIFILFCLIRLRRKHEKKNARCSDWNPARARMLSLVALSLFSSALLLLVPISRPDNQLPNPAVYLGSWLHVYHTISPLSLSLYVYLSLSVYVCYLCTCYQSEYIARNQGQL